MPQENLGRRERKKEEMRRHLLEVAMPLFEQEGFEAVTMERIAAEADVAKATLYSYFPVKEAMLVEWMQLLTAELGGAVEALLRERQTSRARLAALFARLADFVVARRALVERYILFRLSSKERFCGEPALRSGIAGFLQGVLRQGQARGELRRDRSPEELTTHLESLFLSTLMVWFVSSEPATLQERLEGMLTLFFDGAGGGHER
ncbi:MAG TPA: helix-turn-helix domain-containing protein [Gammaproteobacteria bacterium]